MSRFRFHLIATMIVVASLSTGFGIVRAQEGDGDAVVEDAAAAARINALNDEIAARRSDVESLNRNIEAYREKIAALQGSAETLDRELSILENRLAKTILDIEATDADIEVTTAEIEMLEARIDAVEAQLARRRETLAELLRHIDSFDNDFTLQLLFGSDSFGELFARLQELSSVSGDLSDALKRAQAERERLAEDRAEQLGRRERLAELQDAQERHLAQLEQEQGSKELLLAQTERNEATFQEFLRDLRAEQQSVNQEIANLQGEVERKLSALDTGGEGGSALSWPVPVLKGISAEFHDPTYPFRHLFEHSGVDIPVAYGTPVTSSAPGYVAWTRTGRMYGNYVMVIHSGGVATLYAHLSKITVDQDQYVGRGSTIGMSGGVPGTPGAGFSTGAHLHFEVRLNGIPTDPMNYLVQ